MTSDNLSFIHKRFSLQFKKEGLSMKNISHKHFQALVKAFENRGGSYEHLALGATFEATLISMIVKSYIRVTNEKKK